jgi:hypothetical protein
MIISGHYALAANNVAANDQISCSAYRGWPTPSLTLVEPIILKPMGKQRSSIVHWELCFGVQLANISSLGIIYKLFQAEFAYNKQLIGVQCVVLSILFMGLILEH